MGGKGWSLAPLARDYKRISFPELERGRGKCNSGSLLFVPVGIVSDQYEMTRPPSEDVSILVRWTRSHVSLAVIRFAF